MIAVAHHLIKLHFDGWPTKGSDFYQWVDSDSEDIYPLGWAELVGHEFQSTPSPYVPSYVSEPEPNAPTDLVCEEEPTHSSNTASI